MDAVVTAGGIPTPEDPLYLYTQGEAKALLDIAGKSMIQWVLDALSGAQTIDRIVVIGLNSETTVTSSKPMTFIPNQGGLLDNARAGINKVVDINPDAELVLMVSSDIPGITSEMVDWSVTSALETEHDLYYNVIQRPAMETRFPESNRSYVHLKDGDVCGADMNVIRCSVAAGNDELWSRLIAARKNALKQAALIGYSTLFLLLLRRLSLADAVPRASRGLGLRGRAIVCPFPEMGMDVDKPFQYEIIRSYLEASIAA
jgi:GTP:adenosylcobinamide-phosphate guanylyltransferase